MTKSTAVADAKEIQKMFGSNYYAASLLLPRGIKEDVFIFYAFVRIADELVDNPDDIDPALALQSFREEWDQAQRGKAGSNSILSSFADLCIRHEIDPALITAFLDAMESDLHTSRYQTYDELQTYMYGSAEVIGLILLRIFDCDDPAAEKPARALGEAMQFTNFLRDIKEDYALRNRIYLPLDDLQRFEITETSLMTTPSSDAVQALMAFEINRAERLYQEAMVGIPLLPRSVQPAVRAAAAIYSEILAEIKRGGYTVPTDKIRFSALKKLYLILKYGYYKK